MVLMPARERRHRGPTVGELHDSRRVLRFGPFVRRCRCRRHGHEHRGRPNQRLHHAISVAGGDRTRFDGVAHKKSQNSPLQGRPAWSLCCPRARRARATTPLQRNAGRRRRHSRSRLGTLIRLPGRVTGQYTAATEDDWRITPPRPPMARAGRGTRRIRLWPARTARFRAREPGTTAHRALAPPQASESSPQTGHP